MLLIIDNYDSFTYNLVQYFQELGEQVHVCKNDQITVAEINVQQPDYIVISPGSGTPKEAGISTTIIQKIANKIPLLGVCLGHQCIAQAFGGKIVPAHTIMHGKTSFIHHLNKGLFAGLTNPFKATRYHSFIVEKTALPACLEITAWTAQNNGEIDEIMGLRHKTLPIMGVQFHPESILTEQGYDLLRNFLTLHTQRYRKLNYRFNRVSSKVGICSDII